MRVRYRELMALLLMLMGGIMLARGLDYAIRSGLGWQGIILAVVAGVLVFALGLSRWRYLRQR